MTLPAALRQAVPRRRLQFIAGRFCAARALAALDARLTDRPVDIGASGEPLWPAGIVGTITHTESQAAAAVARSSDVRGLGLDLANLIAPEVAPTVSAMIATPEELARLDGEDDCWLLTLVFSAKESFYKCLFPSVGRFFDFLDARVLEIDMAREVFRVGLVSSIHSEFRAGFGLEGRFERTLSTVATAVVLGR